MFSGLVLGLYKAVFRNGFVSVQTHFERVNIESGIIAVGENRRISVCFEACWNALIFESAVILSEVRVFGFAIGFEMISETPAKKPRNRPVSVCGAETAANLMTEGECLA